MGYHASTILTMLLNELLHSLRTRTGDGMCRGVLTATASSWVRPYDSCGDLTIVEIEPVSCPGAPGGRGRRARARFLPDPAPDDGNRRGTTSKIELALVQVKGSPHGSPGPPSTSTGLGST